jgi:hypothetical protein
MRSPATFHHITLTVTDLPRSIDWYERVLGMTKVADREGPTWKRALMRSEGGLVIGLTAHEGTGSDRFDERRVGLDHLSIACEDRAEVEAWERRYKTAVNPNARPNVKTASTDPNAPVGPNAPGSQVNVDGKMLPAGLEVGARAAAIAGGSRGLQEFYRRNGVRLDDAWCGNHAAAIIKSRGLQVPQNPQLASNWNTVTELGWSEVKDPQAGDIAVAKPGWSRRGPGTTGTVGSHVTTVESQVDPKTGKFTSFGGNQGDPFRKFDASRFRFYRPPPKVPGQNQPAAPQNAANQPPPAPPGQPQSLVPSFMRGRDAARAARVGDDGKVAQPPPGVVQQNPAAAATVQPQVAPSVPRHPDNPYPAGTPQADIYDKTMAAYKNTPEVIDRSATKKVAVSGNGKVDVSVKTEPKRAASKKDLVKDVPIPRHRQMQPAPTGPDHDAALDS